MRKIRRHERRVLILKTLGFGAALVTSISLLVFAYLNLASAASHSGFLDFASLFFSDFSVAMANFQDYAFSILESFPVFSAAFALGSVIAVVWSGAHFAEEIVAVREYKHLMVAG